MEVAPSHANVPLTPTHRLHKNPKQLQIPVLKPRKYQIGLYEYLDNGGKRAYLAHARRSGKDVICFNYLVKAALERPGAYIHMLPTISQARRVIWNGMTNDGKRIIDLICPKEIREKTSEQDMMIRLVNGSVIWIAGSDNYDSIVGSNFHGVVFSEWSLCDPRAWDYLSPIVLATNGFAIFIGTPRKGRTNHFCKQWHFARDKMREDGSYYADLKTIDDTKVFTRQQIEDEIAAGMPREVANQDYFCDWDGPDQGSIYGDWMRRAHKEGRIKRQMYDARYPVTTAWDFGIRDSTVIAFIQEIGDEIRVIDCHAEKGKGFEHYLAVVKQKPYAYSRHIVPQDAVETEFGSGTTVVEIARNHGVTLTVAPKLSVSAGIVAVRAVLPRMTFDDANCGRLIEGLEQYSYKWDEKLMVFSQNPLHDWCSDFADSLRYFATAPKGIGLIPDWAKALGQPLVNAPGAHHPVLGQSNIGHNGGPPLDASYDPLSAYR